jgi:gamma-glutamylcyclotransferase (GGCT)/AIG2-like uncharacterized protein YtfP
MKKIFVYGTLKTAHRGQDLFRNNRIVAARVRQLIRQDIRNAG